MPRNNHALVALLLATCCVAAGGCALVTTPVALARKAGGGETVRAAFDLKGQATWVSVVADEAVVGAEAAVASGPVAIEARRLLEASPDVTVARQRADAGRVIVVTLAVPDDTERIIGSGQVRTTASARVTVLDAGGSEIWPADGTDGHLVRVRLRDDSRQPPQELLREVHRELGRRVAMLFTPTPV